MLYLFIIIQDIVSERDSLADSRIENEERGFLRTLVKDSVREIQRIPFLNTVEAGKLSKQQWRDFAVQRYLSATLFIELLKAGTVKAYEVGEEEVAAILDRNWRDELGISDKGEQNTERAHALWRHDFYEAIGVRQEDLQTAVPLEGTAEYFRIVRNIIDRGDFAFIAGGILQTEATLPVEFRKLQIGRDKTFPEVFLGQPDDTPEKVSARSRAKLYLDDHIVHDARDHYPQLLGSLEKVSVDCEVATRIGAGIDRMRHAKRLFYESIEESIGVVL